MNPFFCETATFKDPFPFIFSPKNQITTFASVFFSKRPKSYFEERTLGFFFMRFSSFIAQKRLLQTSMGRKTHYKFCCVCVCDKEGKAGADKTREKKKYTVCFFRNGARGVFFVHAYSLTKKGIQKKCTSRVMMYQLSIYAGQI